jgi:Meiotically Up-regulated Gene 113 (MUG113) protein
MPCYVLQAGDTDMVKIGWADSDVEGRRRELQCAHWLELRVIRVIECEAVVERWLHRHFAEYRARGEWFRFVPAMLTITVDELNIPAPRPPSEVIPLANEIEVFLRKTGMSATAFGIQAANDPQLVHELRKGRECRKATRNRVAAFIEGPVPIDPADMRAADLFSEPTP